MRSYPATVQAPQPLIPGKLWYAVYARAQHQKQVATQLARQEVECFLPLYESVRRWKDRRVILNLPLFPGYVFVRLELRDRTKVLQTRSEERRVGKECRL